MSLATTQVRRCARHEFAMLTLELRKNRWVVYGHPESYRHKVRLASYSNFSVALAHYPKAIPDQCNRKFAVVYPA